MENKTALCNCGHTEDVNDIHGIASFDDSMTFDLCDKCFQETGEEVVLDTNSKLSSWRFSNKESQDKIITIQHVPEI